MACSVNWSLQLPIVSTTLYFTVILPSLSPLLLAKSTTTGIVVDDLLLLVLPGERPRRRLEVQTFLVTFVVVGTTAGRLELVLVLQLLELLLLDATSAADAASSTTTDATTFKLCLDANGLGAEKLHDERHVILHEVWCVFCFVCFCFVINK